MSDCPPNAIRRGPDGEVFIDDTCIGCGNCQQRLPVRRDPDGQAAAEEAGLLCMDAVRQGPRPGPADYEWRKKAPQAAGGAGIAKLAIKCDMCSGNAGGPACVRACPTGAAIRVSPDAFLSVARIDEEPDRP